MKFSQLVMLSLVVLLALAPTAFAQNTAEISASAQQEDGTTQVWNWPELGLSFEYPVEWQFTLSAESADFVLYGQPSETSGNFPFVSLQSGNYDPIAENLNDIFLEIAGESELSEVEFAGQPAWQFDYSDDTQSVTFIGFGVGDAQLAMLGLVVPNEQSEAMKSVMDAIVASAELKSFELDTVLLNSQMQFIYDDYGVVGIGNPDAPVKVYEFMDFSCPHCGHFTSSIDRIAQDYVVDEDVFLQIIILDFIGGEASRTATTAQVCAIEFGIGWDVHELLFSEILFSTDENVSYTPEIIASKIAEADLGITADDFATCMAETDITEYSEASLALAQELGVTSTPSLLFSNADTELDFIRGADGEPYRGGLPLILVYDYIDSLLPVGAE